MQHLTLLLLCLLGFQLTAQDVPVVEFGRVPPEDRRLTAAPGDSTAEAYVLYDRQSLDFEYREGEGPLLRETFHTRIKLFRPSSFERANVSIGYNRDYGSIDKLEGIIHLPGGGSLPLPADNIKQEKVRDDYYRVKFTFPQVTEGAIIEYRYVRRTKSILIPTTFVYQQDIPVRWAQFDAMIPPYYGYVTLSTPHLDVNETKITRREWGPNFSPGAYNVNNQRIEHTEVLWAMRDLPAFRDQPYSNNTQDYLPQVRLQLESVQYPGRPKQDIFGSWQTTVEELQDRADFGRYYRNKINYNRVYRDFAATLPEGATQTDIITAAYAFVGQNVRWDDQYRMLASRTPNQVYDSRSGNSADLNMILLALLNESGIAAHPLLVSLRDWGAPVEQYPLLDQFDHLMVYAELEAGPVVMDVNDPDRPVGLPRIQALNHRGWVGDKSNPRWVDLEVPLSRNVTMAQITVAADGTAEVGLRMRMNNYYALETRNRLHSAVNLREAPVAREILELFPGGEITRADKLDDDAAHPDRLDYEVAMRLPAGQLSGDYLYIQPVLFPMLDGQLADAERRTLPVDFPYPWEQRYVANVILPEGYTLEDAPQPVRIGTEDGSVTASYSVSQNAGSNLTLMLTVKLSRTLYPATEYRTLREMFRRIIEMQESPLVLKKQAK